MPTRNNRVVLDLNKAQWMLFYYRNQWNDLRHIKPKFSVMNDVCNPDELVWKNSISIAEYARSENIIDIWTPEVKFQLTANHCVIYSGDKAIAMSKAWREKIFNKNNKTK